MKLFRKILIASGLLVSSMSFAYASNQPIESSRDWNSFKSENNNFCYNVTFSDDSDENYVTVAHFTSNNQYNIISLNFAEDVSQAENITASIDKTISFEMFRINNSVFLMNDQSNMVEHMKKGYKLEVSVKLSNGTYIKKSYSLLGFTKTYKAMSKECGVKPL